MMLRLPFALFLILCLSRLQAQELQPIPLPELEDPEHFSLLAHLQAVGDAIYADRLSVVNLEFEQLSGRIVIRDGRLSLEDLRGHAYGGTARGSVHIGLAQGDIAIALEMENIQLEDFLLRYGGVEDPPSGRISGSVELFLPRGMGNLLHGQAALQLDEGSVISIGPLTDFLVGHPTAEPNQDRAEASIRIENRHAHLESLLITSPSVRLVGQGSIAFDGKTDIVFQPFSTPGYLKGLPLAGGTLRWTLGQITGTLGRFRVSGHISNPQFNRQPF